MPSCPIFFAVMTLLLKHSMNLVTRPNRIHLSLAATSANGRGEIDRVESTIYRRYFIAAIAVALTLGATWGAWLLWKIGLSGKFTGVTIHEVNAHGEAQIFGWVGLFIVGFAYQVFPRLWRTRLAWPGMAIVTFALMMLGLVVRTIGMAAAGAGGAALFAAMIGGAMQIIATILFVTQILVTARHRDEAQGAPYVGFIVAALLFFVAQALLSVWHTYTTMTASSREELLGFVATWQAPLRDLQIHGMALLMIFGVSLRLLCPMYNLPPMPACRQWRTLAILVASVIAEIAIFLAYRFTSNHHVAAMLLIPWLGLAGGAATFTLWLKPWRPLRDVFGEVDRSAKFIRAAYGWLAISMIMLLLLPVYQIVSGIAFSHAYYGAIRHAITVGFISLMIMGMSAKVVPQFAGISDAQFLSPLRGPFALINIGCFLRVSTQTLTDWHPAFFAIVGVSGILEVIALAWWGIGLIRLMRHRVSVSTKGEGHVRSLATIVA